MAVATMHSLMLLSFALVCDAKFDVKEWFAVMHSGDSPPTYKPHCAEGGTRCLAGFSFTGLEAPGAWHNEPEIASGINIDGKDVGATPYKLIVQEGEDWRKANPYDGDTFGLIKSKSGKVIATPRAGGKLYDGQSNMPDYFSLIYSGTVGKVHAIVHMENIPASTALLELNQDQRTGELTITKSTVMDWTKYGGLHAPCAGSLSPWNTHMGSEEWGPPDARKMEACGSCDCASSYARYMLQYFDVPLDCTDFTAWKANYDKHYSPYMYNFAWESGIDGIPTKHMAMGRRGTELPYVMPDEKTVYLTDDSYSAVLTVFVADRPRDLSAGKLWCAIVEQKTEANGGTFEVKAWKDMGHATTADIENVVLQSPKPVFSDLFETANPLPDKTCPSGFTAINAGGVGLECLKVKSGKEKLASRLETRRYAAMLGCTSEFSRQEGVTFSTDTNKLYMGMTNIRKGMTDNHEHDEGGPNAFRLPENKCGCVYEFEVDPNSYFVTTMKGLICGSLSSGDPLNKCDVNGIANPDNVAAMHGHSMLLIGEDTGMHHNNIMWLYDLKENALVGRIGVTPQGAEVCSPYFYPDVGGFSYITMVMQHPNSTAYGPSALGYTVWKRDCDVSYPSFAMPGSGSATRCQNEPASSAFQRGLGSATVAFFALLFLGA